MTPASTTGIVVGILIGGGLAVIALARALITQLRMPPAERKDTARMIAAYCHSPSECEPPCAVHAPSAHKMADWPLSYDPLGDLFERRCPHGIWHPDPDSIARVRARVGDDDAWGASVHSCDGCCGTSTRSR